MTLAEAPMNTLNDLNDLRPWLADLTAAYPEDILFGLADLSGLLPGELAAWPRCVSLAVRMPDDIMDSVRAGPTMPYCDEYLRVNALIDELETRVAERIAECGFAVHPIPASDTRDRVRFLGEFQHKTGAVRSGLGWIGRNCQLVTRAFGPRVRLGTVLTDMPLSGPPAAITRSYCGDCRDCVDACPAHALSGATWTPGLARERLFTPTLCVDWKNENFPHIPRSICGICTSVCPMGSARERKSRRKTGS